VIIVHAIVKPADANSELAAATVRRQLLEPSELQVPASAIWIDLIEPTIEEDQKVQEFVGVPVPTKADPEYTEPPEAHYSENGVRYLHALFISEPDDTPDVTGVTFVIARTALVTVRYHPVETFDLFSQKLCKFPAQALSPDAVALGLISTGLNRSARALTKAGESLDESNPKASQPKSLLGNERDARQSPIPWLSSYPVASSRHRLPACCNWLA